MLLWQANPEVEAQRLRYLLAEEGAQRFARYAAYNLANEPAKCQSLVSMHTSWPPERRLFGQRLNHQIPVEKCSIGQGLADSRQARLVIEQHLHRNCFFGRLTKFGPVIHHWRIQIELAA